MHKGAGCQLRGAGGVAILERALDHRGDRLPAVALLDAGIARAGAAHHVADAPALAAREPAHGQLFNVQGIGGVDVAIVHGRRIAIFPKSRHGPISTWGPSNDGEAPCSTTFRSARATSSAPRPFTTRS